MAPVAETDVVMRFDTGAINADKRAVHTRIRSLKGADGWDRLEFGSLILGHDELIKRLGVGRRINGVIDLEQGIHHLPSGTGAIRSSDGRGGPGAGEVLRVGGADIKFDNRVVRLGRNGRGIKAVAGDCIAIQAVVVHSHKE